MLKNSNRKGLALGAGIALLASMFTAAPAALAADGTELQFTPAKGTSYTSLVTEDFQMAVSFKPAYASNSYARLSYIVEKTAGSLDIQVSTSAEALSVGTLGASSASNTVLASTGTKLTFSPIATTDSGLNGIVLQPSTGSGVANVTTSSAKTTVKVTAFIDSSPTNGVLDPGEWFVTQNVTFIPFSDLTATVTVTSPNEGDTFITASAVVSGINLEQAEGKFFFAFSSSAATMTQSAGIDATKVLSASVAITAAAVDSSVSAQLRYTTSAVSAGAFTGAGDAVTAVSKLIVAARGYSNLTVSALAGTNVTNSLAVRPNAPMTVRAGVSTFSTSVSGAAVLFSVTTSEELSAAKTLTVGTTTYIKSAASFTASAVTAANGFADLVIATAGFPANATITVTATSKGLSNAKTYTLTTPSYKVENDFDVFSTTPGSSLNLGFEVTDQWGAKSPRSDQRIVVTRGGTGFAYAETVSNVSVVAGVASFTFTPSPAAKTGSAKVNTALEQFNSDLNLWQVISGAAGAEIAIEVTSTANAFSVSPAASYSASISYIVDGSISWSSVTTVKVKNPGTEVVVSSNGLIFREAAGKASVSNQITLRADANGGITFDVASTMAGTFTISIAVGTAVTTSQLVVDPAADSAGKSITFDTTTIPAGSTKVITGTLVDANGNPVNTSGSATILVSYLPTGTAGIPIGTMPTETDKDGKFSFTVLTGQSDNGTAAVTAAYYKSGAGTAVKDVLSFTQNITVGGAAAVASNQKLTVGSFKGFVAIYALNYTGQKLSAKVAGKWLVENNLSRFERVVRLTGAAIPIVVDLYIDGKFVRTENIVTK